MGGSAALLEHAGSRPEDGTALPLCERERARRPDPAPRMHLSARHCTRPVCPARPLPSTPPAPCPAEAPSPQGSRVQHPRSLGRIPVSAHNNTGPRGTAPRRPAAKQRRPDQARPTWQTSANVCVRTSAKTARASFNNYEARILARPSREREHVGVEECPCDRPNSFGLSARQLYEGRSHWCQRFHQHAPCPCYLPTELPTHAQLRRM